MAKCNCEHWQECDACRWSRRPSDSEVIATQARRIAELESQLAAQPAWVAWLEKSLNRRAAIEAELHDMASGKRALPDRDRCRAIANELGVPDDCKTRRAYTPSPTITVPDAAPPARCPQHEGT